MPSVMIYVKQQDYDKWLAIENKSGFIHDALFAINDSDILRDPVKHAAFDEAVKVEPPKIRPLSEVVIEENDPYKNLVFVPNDGVYDTELQEKVEADPEMVKELKRRGQVK